MLKRKKNKQKHTCEVSDEELREFCYNVTQSIKLFGCGPAGCSFINDCVKWNMHGIDLYAVGSDIHQLNHINSPNKILLGPESVRRLYDKPQSLLNEGLSKEDENEIRDIILGDEIVFVIGAMGDGIGTYLIPAISRIAKGSGVMSVAYVTKPFSREGDNRMHEADWGIQHLLNIADTTFVVENDKLLEIVPRLPPYSQFTVAVDNFVSLLKGIVEIFTKVGIVNMDPMDLKSIFRSSSIGYIGMGKSDSDNRISEAVDEVLNFSLTDMVPSKVGGALINITGGEDMSIREAERAVIMICERINPNAQIIWGAQVNPNLDRAVEILAILK